jgi:dinuclear metal center YbgI/SA1388 family protein
LQEGARVVQRQELIAWCDDRLRASAFQDVAVNGLQVEGTRDISRVAVAVSTSRVTIEEAGAWGADALLVHHGLLWGGRMAPITGIFADRLRLLLHHDLNLIAYHLPLDSHAAIGNCALLCRAAGYEPVGRFAQVGSEPLGVVGERRPWLTLVDLLDEMTRVTEREPVAVGALDRYERFERVGFITGSGYSGLTDALHAGCQALVTGDIREPTMAEARELGLVVVAAGHEATERLGVQALAAELETHFGVETRFFADPNPI